jgi:hypothetical protein
MTRKQAAKKAAKARWAKVNGLTPQQRAAITRKKRAQLQSKREFYMNTKGAPALRVVLVKKDRSGRQWFSFA